MLQKKHDTFDFPKGVWRDVLGTPSTHGIWLVYGSEKHGKTTIALKLAELFSTLVRTDYISAEEGVDKEFIDACKRAALSADNDQLHFHAYLPLPELQEQLQKRRAAKVLFLDNATIYHDELKGKRLKDFMNANPNLLVVLIAHEERKQPYTSTAQLARKLAKVIIRVEGLTAFIGGRVPGGTLTINESKGTLYHGTEDK